MDSFEFNPPRPLTERERAVTHWLIEHGRATREEKEKFLAQLENATVDGRCECGCATVSFAINGEHSKGIGRLIGDSFFDTEKGRSGIFAYVSGGLLGGIEVYALGDHDIPAELPPPETLRF